MEFGLVRRGGEPKTIIDSDEHIHALAEGLLKLRDAMRGGNPAGGSECMRGVYRLYVTTSCRMARPYSDYQYISLKLADIDYLSQIFNVVQQQLDDDVVAMPYVWSYVTTALTSLTYV